jgi:hypothetical protein
LEVKRVERGQGGELLKPHVRDDAPVQVELGERSKAAQLAQPHVRDLVAVAEVERGERRQAALRACPGLSTRGSR